jgi:hypothetical protein
MKRYVPLEYPKWINGVVVQSVDEEQACRAGQDEGAALAGAEGPVQRPSRASIRMRRTRERRREGKLSIRCELSIIQIEALASAGLIDPVVRNDMTEVARGVCRLLDRLTGQSEAPATLAGK